MARVRPQPIEMLPESHLVTSEFVQAAYEIKESFSDQAGYEPLLCPPALWVEAEIVDDEQAYVLLQGSYPGYFLVVDLKNVGGTLKFWNVTCRSDPSDVVKAFYAWYLDYIGDPAGRLRTSLVDEAHRDSQFLSESYIQPVDETLASFGNGGGFDPILRAQDIPQQIEVEAGA